MSSASGDVSLLERVVTAMNTTGGAGGVGKLVFSAGAEQLAVIAYVPAARAAEIDVAEWAQAVLSEMGEVGGVGSRQ